MSWWILSRRRRKATRLTTQTPTLQNTKKSSQTNQTQTLTTNKPNETNKPINHLLHKTKAILTLIIPSLVSNNPKPRSSKRMRLVGTGPRAINLEPFKNPSLQRIGRRKRTRKARTTATMPITMALGDNSSIKRKLNSQHLRCLRRPNKKQLRLNNSSSNPSLSSNLLQAIILSLAPRAKTPNPPPRQRTNLLQWLSIRIATTSLRRWLPAAKTATKIIIVIKQRLLINSRQKPIMAKTNR